MFIKTAADVRPLEEDLAEIGLQAPVLSEGKKTFKRKSEGGSLAKKYATDRAARKNVLVQHNDQVSTLIEEVDDLVASLEESDGAEVVKAFANAALLGDALAERFLWIAEILAESEDAEQAEHFVELSEQFEALSADAAEKAESLTSTLSEGAFDEIDMSIVEGDFKEMMSALLDGLDIYSDVTEEDDDEDDDDEDDEKKSKKDDDDEDDEKKEKKKNPFEKKESSSNPS